MNEAFSDLRGALQARLRIVADHQLRDRDPRAHLDQLKAAASRLEAAIRQLPPQCNPELRHFLQKQSYVKALAWLESQN